MPEPARIALLVAGVLPASVALPSGIRTFALVALLSLAVAPLLGCPHIVFGVSAHMRGDSLRSGQNGRAFEGGEHNVKYLHTMVRVTNLDASLDFYCDKLGLEEVDRMEVEAGRFTLVFLAAPGDHEAQIELTYNWDPETLQGGRNFGHIAYEVDDIYAVCERLRAGGVTICRPPRDGEMAFVRSPDGISIELVQAGDPLPSREPWASLPNVGEW